MSAIPRAAAILSLALQMAPGPWCVDCPEPCAADVSQLECCPSECCCPSEADASNGPRSGSPCECCATPTNSDLPSFPLPPAPSKADRGADASCVLLAAIDLPMADSPIILTPRDGGLPPAPRARSIQSILCIWLT